MLVNSCWTEIVKINVLVCCQYINRSLQNNLTTLNTWRISAVFRAPSTKLKHKLCWGLLLIDFKTWGETFFGRFITFADCLLLKLVVDVNFTVIIALRSNNKSVLCKLNIMCRLVTLKHVICRHYHHQRILYFKLQR